MTEQKNLTEGPILKQIITLAIPIIASSFMHMAYNMTDIFWVGKISADAIAAVSAVGYIIWFGFSLSMIAKIGVEVGLSQSIGKKKQHRITHFASSAIQFTTLLSLIFSFICFLFSQEIIELIFSFNSDLVTKTASNYLRISSIGFLFTFTNPVFNGILNGLGDTKTPFRLISTGIILNIILDPIFIFGFGIIPAFGAEGAAIASVISAIFSFILFCNTFSKKSTFAFKDIFELKNKLIYLSQIVKVGTPVAAQITLFSVFAMLITRIVTHWGDIPVAVISIGANIEALSWMTAGGISTALSTFTGQNFGAKNYIRMANGYISALFVAGIWGSIISTLLFIWGGDIIGLFNSDKDLISIGWNYMHIVAISQLFMCIEIATTGALSGISRTMPSAIVSISCNGLRVIAAYLLAFHTPLALDGVWWSISISSVFKGTILVVWFVLILKQYFTKTPVRFSFYKLSIKEIEIESPRERL